MDDERAQISVLYAKALELRLEPRFTGRNATVVGAILIALSITACRSAASKPEQEYYGAQIGIVNHTDRYIDSASVGGVGGGNSYGYHAGVANICCVRVPVKWHPGLRLVVRWNMPDNVTPVHKEKIVDVEKYDEPGSVYVHFFPRDHVRIVVTKSAGFSNKHPISPPSRQLYENLQKLNKHSGS